MTIAVTSAVHPNQRSHLYTWTSLVTTTNHTGDGIDCPGAADKTVSMVAANAGGATCAIEGSNDNSNWFTLTRADGTAASATASAMFALTENPRYIRPRLTTVGAAADWTVVIHARSTV